MIIRVGVEYQVEVPSLIPGCQSLQLKIRNYYSRIMFNNKYAKAHALLDNGKESGWSVNHQPIFACDSMDAALVTAQGRKAGSQTKAWTKIERDSFLLGLYFFGKNLLMARKFVESRDMGDILAYYYGKFYRSSVYRSWSESRKLKSRRYVHGQRILTGWRQRELLSRLFCHVSEECQKQLSEVSTTFAEGKLSLEEYVFTLRNMVGTNMLVEAIAIGKGKKDLTRTAMDPSKANHSIPLGAGVPSGKECSSLSSSEIVKFLTGDFRLSKARSSDLFWEAVWPRLLAGGWHSEQPRNAAYADPNYLVYIIPGVKNFSRKLMRGTQYFDSIRDVLKKVASEPHLLEFDNEAAEDSTKMKDDVLALRTEQDLEGLSNQRCHTYLQTPISTCSQNLMKFTVVDTSLFRESGRVNVRELRFLPPDPLSKCVEPACSNKEDRISDPLEDVTESRPCNDTADCETDNFKKQLPTASDPMNTSVENHYDRSSTASTSWKSKMTVKFQFSRRLKNNKLHHSASITDEQNFTCGSNKNSTNDAESISMDANSNVRGSSCLKRSPVTELYLNSSSNSTFSGIPEERSESNVSKNVPASELCNEKSEFEILIGLNSPQVALVEEFSTVTPNSIDSSFDESFLHSKGTQQSGMLVTNNARVPVEMQPVIDGRRQSTRNKPSTKGLEAIAYGFIGTKQKRKNLEADSQDYYVSMPSRKQMLMDFILVKMRLLESLQNYLGEHGWCFCYRDHNMDKVDRDELLIKYP
ncbi:unnamed protein product [Fraxinus pennsylvanica]|uniref:SANT domain-containing protein n=1 Tax=Fraxinus pennsylvanica TaxID=56036 RepID=A0AAD2EEX1_9LAMI|nr:unnamed protein product [Fraxinus pennsylvanica]